LTEDTICCTRYVSPSHLTTLICSM
jgi:hypothetical protein